MAGRGARLEETTMQCSPLGFIVTLALSILLGPLATAAQPPAKVARIGYLSPLGGTRSVIPGAFLEAFLDGGAFLEAFVQGLRDLGYSDGHNLALEFRFAEGKFPQLPALAAALVQQQVDVIVTLGNAAARAAKAATTTIPIVMTAADDPVATGLVASLAAPGGNLTGLSSLATELSSKRLELLKEAVPTLSRVAVLWNAAAPAMTLRFAQIQGAAQALGVTLHPLGVKDANDVESAIAAMTQERPDVLFIITDVLTARHSQRLVDFAAHSQLPTMFEYKGAVAVGGLMAYGPSLVEQHRRAAYYVDRILKGTKPADLPIEQPMKFELVINLKAAKALGITMPPSLLLLADEVIQ
jgi:putative ABC transport system substrate-binding protein